MGPDHDVGLDADREHRDPRRTEPGRPAPEREQDCRHPGQEDGEAGNARFGADLGVRRLARLDLDARPRSGDARVPEPEAERMVDHGADAVPEVAEVARRRGVAGAERIVADAGVLLALAAQVIELALGVARRGADVRERLDEADADYERGDGQRNRQEPPLSYRQHDETEREGKVGRAGVCPQEAGVRDHARRHGPPRAPARDEIEQHDHEHVQVASGLRKPETSRRIGLFSSPVLKIQFSGSPEMPW